MAKVAFQLPNSYFSPLALPSLPLPFFSSYLRTSLFKITFSSYLALPSRHRSANNTPTLIDTRPSPAVSLASHPPPTTLHST
jgi:hypothetical protein